MGTKEGIKATENLIKASATRYPQYWEEIEGIIAGSRAPRLLVKTILRLQSLVRIVSLS